MSVATQDAVVPSVPGVSPAAVPVVEATPSATPSSSEAKELSTAISALLTPTVNIGEIIRNAIRAQQLLNKEIDDLNGKLAMSNVATTTHQKQIEMYTTRLKMARSRIEMINRVLSLVHQRLGKVYEKLQARTAQLQRNNEILRDDIVQQAAAANTARPDAGANEPQATASPPAVVTQPEVLPASSDAANVADTKEGE